MKMAENYGLKNIYFKPFVSKEKYPELVKDADVGLVCLSSKNKTPVVPGKILGYMAASIPVVAFLNKESDGHVIISDSRCGFSTVSDDEKRAAGLIFPYRLRSLPKISWLRWKYCSSDASDIACHKRKNRWENHVCGR